MTFSFRVTFAFDYTEFRIEPLKSGPPFPLGA